MTTKQERFISKIIKEELGQVLSEVDTNKVSDHDLKWFITNLEKFISENNQSEHLPQIKFNGENSSSKWISVPIKFLEDILNLAKTKKNFFKKNK